MISFFNKNYCKVFKKCCSEIGGRLRLQMHVKNAIFSKVARRRTYATLQKISSILVIF